MNEEIPIYVISKSAITYLLEVNSSMCNVIESLKSDEYISVLFIEQGRVHKTLLKTSEVESIYEERILND